MNQAEARAHWPNNKYVIVAKNLKKLHGYLRIQAQDPAFFHENFRQLQSFFFLAAPWSFEKLATARNRDKNQTSLGGLEPPTFRLTAERANRLRHRDPMYVAQSKLVCPLQASYTRLLAKDNG